MEKIRNYQEIREERLIKEVNGYIEKSPKNIRKKLKEFDNNLINKELKLTSRSAYLQKLCKVFEVLNKDCNKLNKKDMENLILYLNKTYSKSSIYHYKLAIKIFFKWLHKGKEPALTKWIKLTRSKNGNKLPEEMLSRDDIIKMVGVAENLRDKAIIFSFYESACRLSEFLGLKLKNVRFDEYGAVLMVDGKTGQRRIRLISSSPDLKNYINNHPHKDNLNYPLWINIGNKRANGLSFHGMRGLLKKYSKLAGIKVENVHPHLFRHSRLTHMCSDGFTEMELRNIAGWSSDSQMPKIYLHLSSKDIDRKMLEKYGVVKGESKEKEKLEPKRCPACNKVNSASSKFCSSPSCNFILDNKFALEVDNKIIDRVNEKDNELIERLRGLIKETIEELNLKDRIKEL